MLITLAYRLPREHLDSLLGSVTAYPLTEVFQSAWDSLPGSEGRWRQPYAALATGLTAATERPVRLFGESDLAEDERASGSRMLLLTSDGALDYRLRVAVRAWERHIRGGDGTLALAELLPAPEQARSFADFIRFRTGQVPTAPNWVFRTAVWQVMRRVAESPLLVDGREPVALRMDTDGSLLAWNPEDLIVNRSGTAFSMARVSARLVTRAGIEDPVLCFDAHLSRISPQGQYSKNVWIARGGSPLLHLPVRRRLDKRNGVWLSHLNPAIERVLEACQLEPLKIPAVLPDVPDLIRHQLVTSRFYILGSGPGPRFMLRLHEHVIRTLPILVPLTYQPDKEIRLPKRVTKYPAGGLPTAGVGPSGYKRVTIACLYRTPEARQRMLTELKELTGHQISPEPGGPAVAVNERLDVIARHCPDLLDHEAPNRVALLADSLGSARGDGHLVAAWLETEYHPAAEPPELDAKPHLRRLLGHLGIPTQFLATEPLVLPEKAKRRSPGEKKHAARAALRDLLRAAGVLDDRLLAAISGNGMPNRLDRKALLVGIHARRQQTGGDDAPLVLTMIALYVDPDDLESWRVLMYSDKRRTWVRVAEAIADFHSGSIGTTRLGRTEAKADRTRDEIEGRLRDLASADLAGLPLVIFVDTQSTRTIWPGLQDVKLGAGQLPGDTLTGRGDDVAVVRLNTDIAEIGRPVTRVEKANMPADRRQPAAPDRKVYRLMDSGLPSWLFAGRSVLIKSKRGDRGARYTRWTLPPELKSELGVPWHAYTAKEIIIVRAGSWTPEALTALTASLCEQPISWDDRTLVPGPLHLSTAVDKDHPDYRVSGEGDEGET